MKLEIEAVPDLDLTWVRWPTSASIPSHIITRVASLLIASEWIYPRVVSPKAGPRQQVILYPLSAPSVNLLPTSNIDHDSDFPDDINDTQLHVSALDLRRILHIAEIRLRPLDRKVSATGDQGNKPHLKRTILGTGL